MVVSNDRNMSRSDISTSSCPLCNSDIATLKWHVNFRERNFDYVKCNSCDLIYIAPLPAQADVIKAYYESSSEYWFQQDYFQFLVDLDQRTGDSTRVAKLIHKYLSPNQTGSASALDIGAGAGTLMLAMQNEFCSQVEGLEPGELGQKGAEKFNLPIYRTSLEEFETNKTYDVVTLMSVIEHTPDPCSMLKNIRRLVKDDGLLVMETPNADSLMTMLRQSRWGALLPPAHMIIFTPKTMDQFLRNTGFRSVKYLLNGDYPLLSRLRLHTWLRKTQLDLGISLPKTDNMLVFARPI